MATVEFQGKLYTLNQVQEDLFEFIDNSKPGEYTRYYNQIVFHTERNGFVAAYADDLNNCWTI